LYAHKFSWKSISVEIVERKIESIAPGRVGHAGTSPISLGSPAGPLHRSSHELHPVETAETAVSAAFLFGVPERLDRAVELFLKRLLAVVKQQAGWPRPEKYAESGSFVSGLHSGYGGSPWESYPTSRRPHTVANRHLHVVVLALCDEATIPICSAITGTACSFRGPKACRSPLRR
jgi:hypothetical protein